MMTFLMSFDEAGRKYKETYRSLCVLLIYYLAVFLRQFAIQKSDTEKVFRKQHPMMSNYIELFMFTFANIFP